MTTIPLWDFLGWMALDLALIAVIAYWPEIRKAVREWKAMRRYDDYGGGPES